MWELFGLDIKPEQTNSIGKQTHSEVATANKILRKLGYTVKKVRAEGVRGAQVRVYAVVDTDCQHRQTIYDALQLKYQNYMLSNGQSDAVSTSPNTDKALGVVLTPGDKPIAAIPDDDPLHFSRRGDIVETPRTEGNTPNIGDRVVVAGEVVTVDLVDGLLAGGWSDDGVYIYGEVAA